MAEDTHSFCNTDWQKAQEQYLEALKSFSDEIGLASDADAAHPWLQAFASWPLANPSGNANDQRDVLANVLEQAQVFCSMKAQFGELLQQMADSDEWQAVLDDYFEQMKRSFRRQASADNPWQGHCQQWLKAFSSAAIFSEDVLKRQEKLAFPDLSAFPPPSTAEQSREYQNGLQQNARLWQGCLENYREYDKVLSAIACEAIDSLHEKILYLAGRDEKIHSLRELYGLWIAAQEEAYAKTVFTDEYAELHGRLINSLMALKQHNQDMFAATLAAFNLPGRAEMTSISKAQQHLRRGQQRHTSELGALKKELEEIRRRLASMQDESARKKT